MPIRPNFTDVQLSGDTVEVHGLSADDELGDLLDIRVVLSQGKRIGRAGVGRIVSAWQADLPVTDPDGGAPDYQTGEAVAFGIETHGENLRTITWAQTVQIARRA
jgi:hypothetical protein